MRIRFKITQALLGAAKHDLLRPHPFAAERVGFLSCRVGATDSDGLIVLAHAYHAVEDADYVDDPTAGATMGPDAIRKVSIEIPPVMIDKQVDSDLEDLRNRLSQEQQTLENYLRLKGQREDELREELRPEAVRRLRNSLVLREIATREGVSVSAQDIDAEIDRMIGTSENRDQLRQIYSGNYIRNLLENELFERKLMDHVIGIATEGRGPADPPEEPEEEPTAEASADDAAASDESVAEQVAELESEAAVDAELAPGAVASEDEAGAETGEEPEEEKPANQV